MNVALASSYMLFHTFGPLFWTSRDGISVTNSKHFWSNWEEKSYLLKKGTISMFIFQQTDFNPKIEINELLFGCKECMKHWKSWIIRLFFFLANLHHPFYKSTKEGRLHLAVF